MALLKIVSGGQTGVDRAALDAELSSPIPMSARLVGSIGESLTGGPNEPTAPIGGPWHAEFGYPKKSGTRPPWIGLLL